MSELAVFFSYKSASKVRFLNSVHRTRDQEFAGLNVDEAIQAVKFHPTKVTGTGDFIERPAVDLFA